MKNSPLKIEIKNGLLSISIGVETLAFAINNGDFPDINVINAENFAKDIVHELQNEEEDGSTVVHYLLESAALKAADNGSEWCEDRKMKESWVICSNCSGCKSEAYELDNIKLIRRCSKCDGRGEVKIYGKS